MSPMETLAIILLLLVCAACVAALAFSARARRRMARFLEERDPASNGRLTTDGASPTTARLVRAINHQLDEEAANRRRQKQSEREFEQNLANLSHDIRTPLTGAKGYLQLAAEEADAAQRSAYLTAAATRLDDMGVLLDQLLDYARSTSEDALEPERLDVLLPLASVLAAKHPEFLESGMDVEVSFEDERLVTTADEQALRRVFENVMENALVHGTGVLLITQTGSSLMFENGLRPGEYPDPERVFDRFYREDAARNRTGAGLGLAVVRNLAEAQSITPNAAVTEGAFTLRLDFP